MNDMKDGLKKLTKEELIKLILEISDKDSNCSCFIDNRLNKKSFNNTKVKSFQKKLLNHRINYIQAYNIFKEYSLFISDNFTLNELIKDYLDYLVIIREELIHDYNEELDSIIVDAFDFACHEFQKHGNKEAIKFIAKKIGSIEYVFEDLLSELSSIFSGYFHEYYDEIS